MALRASWRLALLAPLCLDAGAPQMPMPVRYEETAAYRWQQKPVLETLLLDDMENPANWSLKGNGEMGLTTERAKDGKHSMRLRVKTRVPEDPVPKSKRGYGVTNLVRQFPGEDWSRFNRISFWLYPELPGWRVVNLRLVLRNEGKERLPDVYGNDGKTSLVGLFNHQWNYVVWEIPHLSRDKVTAIEFECRRQGNEPEASDTLTFDIDHLALDRVEADYFEGWNLAPGRVAFSHSGYRPGSRKTAIGSSLAARKFELIDQDTGEVVLSKPVESVQSAIGRFDLLDFSSYSTPGRYALRAGNVSTRPFRIGGEVWRESVRKVVNFFYTERCGWDVPGSHRVCHRDWQGVHGDKRIIINGGWHDAGDLSQGLVNTSEAVYSMFAMAETARASGDEDLARELIEEAKWGLDWVHKTSFGDGFRIVWGTMGLWTDGILGTNDDVTADAQNSPYENFLASAAEAIASRVLKGKDSELAAHSLSMARDDWRFAIEKAESTTGRMARVEVTGAAILASLDLWQATSEKQYADKALELAPAIVKSQERGFQGRQVPITGFFYTGPDRQRLLHYLHRGHEQAPIVAMARLCEAFPEHESWMDWYSVVALHSQYYLKAMAKFTEPYGMLPNGIYREEEYSQFPEARREAARRQVLNGIALGGGYRLRLFPVWFDFRGNYGTMLSEAKALSTASRLRGKPDLTELSELQLQWVVGKNPFAESTLFGEGYDYAPQYSAMSGHLVGALPVGIQTRGDNDVPYWPASNYPNWKEVWVHPASRWLWILSDLNAPVPPKPPLDYGVTSQTGRDGLVSITVTARGLGRHQFAIRASNLVLVELKKETVLHPGAAQTVTWRGKVGSADSPWVAVVIADGDVANRRDTIGSTRDSGDGCQGGIDCP